jgi:hypothetical protein
MALNKQIWLPVVEEIMWPQNMFYDQSVDHTAIGAVFAKTVHVPNAGTFATPVLVNNTTWPLTAEQRTDYDLTYDANTFSNVPLYVNLIELYEFSYPKIVSIVKQMTSALENSVAQQAIYNWAYGLPAGSILQSTGTARPAVFSWQSGTRSGYTYTDFVAAMAILEIQNVPREDRQILVSAAGYQDLMNLGKYQYAFIEMGKLILSGQLNGATPAPSMIGRFLGCDVYLRGNFGVCYDYSVTSTTFVNSATTAAQAADFVLIWQKSKVAQWKGSMANGGIELFEQSKNPFYQADVISAAIRHGSTRIRYDNYGVVQLVEAIA